MSGGPAPSILLPNYDFRPAYWALRRALRQLPTPDKRPAPPIGIVIHSGADGPGTAEWTWKIDRRTRRGLALYWAQFAWWAAMGKYVQTDYLDAWSPHGSIYNAYSIGIEMPGPWHLNPRPTLHQESTVTLVKDILAVYPSIKWITGHMFFDRDKDDPGPGVTAEWFSGLGLDVRWSWVGRSLLPTMTAS